MFKEIIKHDKSFSKHFNKIAFRIYKEYPSNKDKEYEYYGIVVNINEINEKN